MKRWALLLPFLLLAMLMGSCGGETETEGLEYEAAGECWTVTGYHGAGLEVVIPENHEGRAVTAIGKAAFEGSAIECVTVGSNVAEIGDRAFSGCVRLRQVEFAGDSLRRIGALAFSGCTALEELRIPSGVAEVEACAFFRFKSDQKLVILGNTEGWAAWWQDGCAARIEKSGQTAPPG